MALSRIQKIIIWFLSLLSLMTALLVGAYLYLPRYVQTRLIPQLAHSAGLAAQSVRVGHIGLSKAELGPIQLDGDGGPALTVERIHLSYSPATLLYRRIGQIRLEGLVAHVRIVDGAFFIGNTRIAAPETADTEPRDAPTIPALPFRHLEVEAAVLDIAWNTGRLQVPFSLNADATGADEGHWSAEALLTPRRSRVRVTTVVNAAARHVGLEIKEAQTPLEDWVDMIPPDVVPHLHSIGGQLSVRGSAALQLSPLALETAAAEIEIGQLGLAWRHASAEASGSADTPDLPVTIRLDTTVSLSTDRGPSGWTARYTIGIRDLSLRRGESTFVSPQWQLAGEALRHDGLRVDLQSEGVDARIAYDTTTFTIPRTTVEAVIQHSASGLTAQGRGTVRSAELFDSALQLNMRDIAVELPFEWPPPDVSRGGRLAIGRISLQDQNLGDLSGGLQQSGRGVRFDLAHQSQLFPALVVHIKGSADSSGAAVDFNVPDYRPAAPIALRRFAPAAGGMVLGGRFQVQGRLRWSGDAAQTAADIRIDQGTLRDAGRDLHLTGIQGRLHVDDLPTPHSPAGQRLRVEQLKFGKIEATALELSYRIAPRQRLLIDWAGLDWCGGRLESGPIEISPEKSAIEAELTARDLNLAMLLEQLDLAEGSGQGTVRGRIPIRWEDEKLTFGKGSLSSPAGESGVIRLKELQGTEDLLSGLPAETPQHTQLDIAMEALKDYTYTHIDLQVESQEEILVLRLQLNGKPNRLLPFAYDQELGRLKRVQGKGQAEFQGIDIDLNFRSPLNQILNYRELLRTQ